LSLVSFVHWRRGDLVTYLEKNLGDTPPPGVSNAALTILHEVVSEMRRSLRAQVLTGVAQYMADAVTDPRLAFDPMLKLASRRAIFYADAGRLDDAFDCLDQAIASRDPALVYLGVAPQFDSLRGDSRFPGRLKLMALPAGTSSSGEF
jgi:hypothetical protein